MCVFFALLLLNLSLAPNSPILISLKKTKLRSISLSCCIELQGYLEMLFSFSILKFYTWKSKHQSHGISKLDTCHKHFYRKIRFSKLSAKLPRFNMLVIPIKYTVVIQLWFATSNRYRRYFWENCICLLI